MTRLRTHISAAGAICRRDMLTYFSYRGRLATRVLSIVATLAMFYWISRLVNAREFRTANAYFSYVVVGVVIAEALQVTVAVALSLNAELLTGTFERSVCSPYGPINSIVSAMLFPLLLQLALAMTTLGVGGLVFDMRIIWSSALWVAPLALACALAFSSIGFLSAAAVLVAKQSGSITAYGVMFVGLLGGVYFPVQLLPAWTRPITDLQPLTYLVELMRHVLIGYPLRSSPVSAVSHVLGFLLVTGPFGYIALRRGIHFSQRHATLLEY